MTIIQQAVWLYHRFPLSFLARAAPMRTLGRHRDVQELLHQRGIVVRRETLRECLGQNGRRTRRLPAGALNSLPFSQKNCATGNPVGVPGAISTRCGYCRRIQNIPFSWADNCSSAPLNAVLNAACLNSSTVSYGFRLNPALFAGLIRPTGAGTDTHSGRWTCIRRYPGYTGIGRNAYYSAHFSD
jgi:hypothetical protein